MQKIKTKQKKTEATGKGKREKNNETTNNK